jgi:hypothetical protein
MGRVEYEWTPNWNQSYLGRPFARPLGAKLETKIELVTRVNTAGENTPK